MHRGVQHLLRCALFCFSSSCAPHAASFSGMSIFYFALRYYPTLVVICTDCTGSLKSNYHAMTTTKAPRCCVDRVVLFLFLLCFVCFVLYYMVLFCFALFVLFCIIWFCFALIWIVLLYFVLVYFVSYCFVFCFVFVSVSVCWLDFCKGVLHIYII